MALTDLKITKTEAKSEAKKYAIAGPGDGERYSYGTRLTLDDAELKKLGIKELPAVGTVLMFEAKAKVISSRQSATESSDNRSIELQITHMDFETDEGAEEVKEGELTRGEAGAMSRVAKKMQSM
jgi:hypothetical protein